MVSFCNECGELWRTHGTMCRPKSSGSPLTAIVTPVSLDISLDKARALHRVWRALNDGDCPKCHKFNPATNVVRGHVVAIECPECGFSVTRDEIEAIEKMFAPAMNAAVVIFEEWRAKNVADRSAEELELMGYDGLKALSGADQ